MKFEFLWAELLPLSTDPSAVSYPSVNSTFICKFLPLLLWNLQFHNVLNYVVEGPTLATKVCRVTAEDSRKVKIKMLNNN